MVLPIAWVLFSLALIFAAVFGYFLWRFLTDAATSIAGTAVLVYTLGVTLIFSLLLTIPL